MSALTPEQRELHAVVMSALFGAVVAIHPVERGFGFVLPSDAPMLVRAAEFIALERLCCPFFDFALHLPSGSGVATLRISGPDGVEPFVEAEFGRALPAGLRFPAPRPL